MSNKNKGGIYIEIKNDETLDLEINNDNELTNDINLNNKNELEIKQNNFLNSTIGKVINAGFDIGIRALLPNLIEDEVIGLKDNLLRYGLKEGISKSTQSAIEIGKSAIGIVTGNFDNVSQMRIAVQSGGIIDSLSDVIDFAVNKAKSSGIINNNIAKVIKSGKNIILDNVEGNIQKLFQDQTRSIEYLGKYINNWNTYYNSQDFLGMKREYSKIEDMFKNIAPLENTINEVKKIRNMQKLLESNGQNFNLTENELELMKKI